ncbi:MAG: phosphatidate cytidylyltransferase [Bacteroides sp.]|nr:phosphatidate cytidylyltransferase [Bacteroides sp.]MCM1379865.1 phosphatidate cytidylyltransferase [Bacteroides sp.]MCM1446103.1 phosphatidate cytidylyltransferase [Prevotella sp.]
MLKRAIFGAIYVAIIVAGILCGPLCFLILLLMLSTFAENELLVMINPPAENMSEATIGMLQRSLDCVGAAVLIVTTWTNMLFIPGVVTYIAYLILRLTVQLWVRDQDAIRSISSSFMAQLYIAVPIALMNIIYHITPALLLLLFVLVWVNDTFAYLVGRTFGKHRLWERISPKKSWEGFWGGLVFTVIVAGVCGLFFPATFGGFGLIKMAIIGVTVSIAGTLGDLVESLMKRTVGVKDSGTLIPGHGGILDRIDSILLVIPMVLVIIFFMTYAF